MTADFDAGPPPNFLAHFGKLPDLGSFRQYFWADWGPIFYRGRLDGSARLLCIASDPGATERIAGRSLVGDAGQRVQGFLAKLGLSRSYLLLNAHCFGMIPSTASKAKPILSDAQHLAWRNGLYDLARTANLQAIVAFGEHAQEAARLWPGKAGLPLHNLPHPSSHDAVKLANEWRAAIIALRPVVTPDSTSPLPPNYGAELVEADYAVIPRGDLPFGVPGFLGDDRWVRASAKSFASVQRPKPDDRHTLIWKAPKT